MAPERHPETGFLGRHQYTLLLLSLLLVYAIQPFGGSRPWIAGLLQAATVVMMVAALAVVRDRKVLFWVGVGLAVSINALRMFERLRGPEVPGILVNTLEALFFLVLIVAIVGGVVRMRHVTLNSVFGVCSVYLLMALTWFNAYEILELGHPGSFRRPEPMATATATEGVEVDLLYFSLITMTTVGYGDVTPVTPQARTLAALQGLIGQLFLAIFVARIVSMEISDRMARRTPPDDDREPTA